MNIKNKNDICVIGNGRFGQAVIDQLLKMNKSLFIIDKDPETAKMYAKEVERIVITDAADIKALKEIKIDQMETVVVAAPDNIEIIASLLELKIKNIIARATSEKHALVLKQIGVKVIIRPEYESGIRTALIAANNSFISYSENIQEIDADFVVGNVEIKNAEIHNKMIKNLDLNQKGITIILVKRRDVVMRAFGDFELQVGDKISIVGKVKDVTEGMEWLAKGDE
ncbi:TrkA family potassium uptake protein [Mycoplasma sp. Ms02]|uniref:potassium channel family protein n=1 Tax=Mycoplasma sp. Ms02 TaxID=353851 RepID=UPI001C8AFB4F|nr:TrkA family potassium uptake protein [Mycoplasma sp. Ms02]QZE12281.1 TrkA family potassium uptake protein [Mycoplasma sp. Ms02]